MSETSRFQRFASGSLCVALGLCVAACEPRGSRPAPNAPASHADAPTNPGEPASAPAVSGPDWFAPIDLTGTEPFWAMKIRRDGLALEGVDRPKLVAPNPGPASSQTRATWDAPVAGGALKVALEALNCSDGMSDRTYPYTATVVIGDETLKGCGAPQNYFRDRP